MIAYDVFNGDADGICALHQLRLKDPLPDAHLVTGVKRDIRLLETIHHVKNSHITVLDVSMDRNREPLLTLLAHGNSIVYIDHHFSGDIPENSALQAHIDPAPLTCTSMIVDKLLGGTTANGPLSAPLATILTKPLSGPPEPWPWHPTRSNNFGKPAFC